MDRKIKWLFVIAYILIGVLFLLSLYMLTGGGGL